MDLPPQLIHQLAMLTEALDIDGADLQAMLEVLIDDVIHAVPTFAGLQMLITLSGVTTVTDVPIAAVPVKASIHLPLPTADPNAGISATFYAGAAGAFDALAADLRLALGLDGEVIIDGHLDGHLEGQPVDPGRSGGELESTLQTSLRQQAIGVLIGQGHHPDQAAAELRRQAHAYGVSEIERARQLLHPQ